MHRLPGLVVALALALAPAPPAAGFDQPSAVTPADPPFAGAVDQATDGEGDTTFLYVSDGFTLVTRQSGGRLSDPVHVADIQHTWSEAQVLLDADGGGLVVWDQIPFEPFESYVLGRRFSAAGELGPVTRLTPPDDYTEGARAALRPDGSGVLTWIRWTGEGGYTPYVRTLGAGGSLGPAHRLGRGPDSSTPHIGFDRSGRATLLWSEPDLVARHLGVDGELGPRRVVRPEGWYDEWLLAEEVGVDGRGVLTAACTHHSRNTAPYAGQDNSYQRACLLRISPRLRLLDLRNVSRDGLTVMDQVHVGVAASGVAVVGWSRNWQDGGWVRRVAAGGALSAPTRVTEAYVSDIALGRDGDGVVVSSDWRGDGRGDGDLTLVRAALVSDGVVRRSRVVGTSSSDLSYVRGEAGRGGALVAWEDFADARIMAAGR